MRNVIISFAVMAISAFVILSVNENRKFDSLISVNAEALAKVEQPDVNDCIKDPNYDCEALHPTDPSKDKYREDARW